MSEASENSDLSALLCVGDTVITSTFFGTNEFVITRVTKTLAMSKRESDGYEHKFKRRISHDMGHPSERFNITNYSVKRKDT